MTIACFEQPLSGIEFQRGALVPIKATLFAKEAVTILKRWLFARGRNAFIEATIREGPL